MKCAGELTSFGGPTLQRRLAVWLSLVAMVMAGHWVVAVAARAVLDEDGVAEAVLGQAALSRLALVLLLAAGASLPSGWVLSTSGLLAIEVGACFVVAASCIAGAVGSAPALRTDLTLLLTVSIVLAARAALVPSTMRRTLLVGIAALAPVVLVVPSVIPASMHLGSTRLRTLSTVTVVSHGAAALGSTVLTSWIIYRRRRSMGRAAQIGDYEIGPLLGQGGFGAVFSARHVVLGRPTALKLTRPSRLASPFVERFEEEARLMAELSHPNIVSLYEFGRTPDGTVFLAMERVDGETLEDLVRSSGGLGARRATRLLRQLASGLAHAHGRGLVHGDVKPSNAMVLQTDGYSDLVKVLDFGLARRLATTRAARGEVVGTPLFMAPEVIAGGEPTAESDVYSFGTVAYALLTGRHLFAELPPERQAAAHRFEPVVPPSVRTHRPIPHALETIVLRCLSKKPSERFRDGRQLMDALDDVDDLAAVREEPCPRHGASSASAMAVHFAKDGR